jgi:adenosylcobinamide-GDP ribazoletransferase
MIREWRLLLVAVQFLTRIPTPQVHELPAEWLARSGKYFPLVGGLVGGLSALALMGAHVLWPSGFLPAVLALSVGLIVTGALHEDGLADTADALGGGRSAQQRLEIMKDPRIGTYGALALGMTLALKAGSLSAMPYRLAATGLICAHIGGRTAAVWAMSLMPYAGDRLASRLTAPERALRPWELGVSLALALVPSLLLIGPIAGMIALAAGVLACLSLGLAAVRWIGGHTGDVLGAIEQVYEIVFVLVLSGLAAAGGTFAR